MGRKRGFRPASPRSSLSLHAPTCLTSPSREKKKKKKKGLCHRSEAAVHASQAWPIPTCWGPPGRVSREKKRAKWMEGKGQGAGMPNVACGGHRSRPSLAPLAAATSTPDCSTPTVRALPEGHPVRTCLPLASSPKPRARASESARDPALHTGEGIQHQSLGHPGRHLPAGRRSSALEAARSRRSRSQTRGRCSRSAPPGSGFLRARTFPRRGNTSS